MKYRYRVLGLLALLNIITYLDRVCISVAGPRMQDELHIGTLAWGWVTGIFAFAYGAFQIPSGSLGDRAGPRRVLTVIVLCFSIFTSLTGAVSSYYFLLLTRFCFGVGQAGTVPNGQVVVARWYPLLERARVCGLGNVAVQIGGAISPLLVVPIQLRYGWRASFYVFGFLGIAWSVAWYNWFRDSPTEKVGVSKAELDEIGILSTVRLRKTRPSMPWAIALRAGNLRAALMIAACYMYTLYFFQSWFHTFLVRGRGYNLGDLPISALPFVVGGFAGGLGGVVSDALARKMGLRWGRRWPGILGLGMAALSMVAAVLSQRKFITLTFLSVAYGCVAFQVPILFAVCLDIGRSYAGVVTGLVNTAGQIGALLSSLGFGYLVSRHSDYNAPLIPMAALLLLGALLWLKIDATRTLAPDPGMEAPENISPISRYP
jgi:sugar phosphate permease